GSVVKLASEALGSLPFDVGVFDVGVEVAGYAQDDRVRGHLVVRASASQRRHAPDQPATFEELDAGARGSLGDAQRACDLGDGLFGRSQMSSQPSIVPYDGGRPMSASTSAASSSNCCSGERSMFPTFGKF